jgi:general secretion pathway protein E/type IV pilus assembly protein PilB
MAQRLGEILIRRGAATVEEVADALTKRKQGERIGETLVRLGYATPREIARALSEQTGIELVELKEFTPAKALMEKVPTKFIFKARLVPMEISGGKLVVATADPFAVHDLDELRLLTGLNIEPRLAAADDVEDAIHKLYGVGADALMRAQDDGIVVIAEDDEATREKDLDQDEDAALIQFVNRVLLDAVAERSSDIHIEPEERDLSVRYRIDGVLHDAKLPRELKKFQAAILSRLKIMANLDIAEKRLPQDGRIKIRAGGKEMDIRVSIIPTLHGEGVALRILDNEGLGRGLAQVGLAPPAAKLMLEMLDNPHGIVLVTGPTGSGKSTTLYAGLQTVDRKSLKVITVEDPVEYRLSGVAQIQIKEKIGLTFARGLRSILRHDPDVVMVGEIRDRETAEISVQAALTGHLVLSTLHTNDATGAIARLIDMGVEPYLVASTIEGLVAQRLVRRICKECVETHPVDKDPYGHFVHEMGVKDLPMVRRGKGCEACRGTGFKGRCGIFELIKVTDGLRELAMEGASQVKLRAYAREQGFAGLREDGLRLLREGVTTPEEVAHSTRDELR